MSVNETSLLRVVDLRKSFDAPNGNRVEVLRGVDFDSYAGESIAIVGASGSGKSTLLHLIGGLDKADHGSVSLAGVETGALRGRQLSTFRQRKIGFVFQFHYLLADLSALENVVLPLRIARHDNRESLKKASQLLLEIGLEAHLDYPISHLSGGEQQRVALARALVTDPELLLADEPTGNLDAGIGLEISKFLVNFTHNRSRTCIIATHNQSLAELCDRVLLLENGRLRAV